MTMTSEPNLVDFWFDPVCPYSWTASRWLREVDQRRPLRVRHHVMSLYLLNEHRTDLSAEYRRVVASSRGPARVAAAVATRHGEQVLEDFYTDFGELVFEHWHHPSVAEYHEAIRAALAQAGLPGDLEGAMESHEYDAPMRRSHQAGIALVGDEVGTPITRIDGVAFYGPVLNAIPRGEEAIQVFDGARLLAGYAQFFELERTRVHPPVFT